MNVSEFPRAKLNSLSSPPNSFLLQILPFQVNGSAASSVTMSENRKSPMPLTHSHGHQVSKACPQPLLAFLCSSLSGSDFHGVLFYFTGETASQQIILPPLMLPSNPPFISTRASLSKHISAPVPLLLKAFHPTAHKRVPTRLTKHANLL